MVQGLAVFGQVGVHTDTPDNSSAMDIVSGNRGLLIPRVTLTSNLTSPSPVTNPAVGLLVFNSGSNQPIGFYYWDGAHWVSLGGSASGDYWSLYGNAGTSAGDNFIGTTDAQDFLLFTDNTQRMKIEQDGQVLVAGNTPNSAAHVFTVFGNATQNYAYAAYSPKIGYYNNGGQFGVVSYVDTAFVSISAYGSSILGKNFDATGYGIVGVGSNRGIAFLRNHSTGVTGTGNDGVFALAQSTNGTGVLAVGGNADTCYFHPSGTGGAFTGYHGIFSRARNGSGTGIISAGNNASPFSLSGGSGGAFTGTTTGMIAFTTASTSTGIIGLGGSSASITVTNGSGGVLRGYHGAFCKSDNASGIGVIGCGSGLSTFSTITNGVGGTFAGFHGVLATTANAAGTGVVASGNNLGYSTYSSGSGGAFTGLDAGAVGYATDATDGIGVIGAGNGLAANVPTTGCGGAFTGTVCGVYGYATNNSNGTYGGYFSNGGGTSYAYVGYRVSNQNRKIVGNGTASSIVKNIQGEPVILTCPEAPETVLQDFGTGRLTEGRAHIDIDPDLAINLNVSESHPLKVYITPEGDCNGVYVTNKSAYGFDVIELQGGRSNVPFSWQIVATRANEEYTLEDGTIEVSDYSTRFPPAPGPLELNPDSGTIKHPSSRESAIEGPPAEVVSTKAATQVIQDKDILNP